MNDPSPGGEAAAPASPSANAVAAVAPAVASAARWFWWIAGLSLVNVILSLSQSKETFVVGLGVTALADAAFAHARPVAVLIDALVLAFFVAMGVFAGRGLRWAFLAGAAVYALDALLYLQYFTDPWMPVGFHVLVLFFISRGLSALKVASPPQP